MLVSSSPKRAPRESSASWLPSRHLTAPPLSRSRRRTSSIAPMPSGPRSVRSPRSQTRASAPDHRSSPDRRAPHRGGAPRARRDSRGRRPRRRPAPRSLWHGPRPGGAGSLAPRLLHQAAELADELERLAVLDEALEERELGLEPVRVHGRPRDQVDLRVLARRHRLAVPDELLVELLARRRADELDRDLASRAPCPRAGSSSPRGRRSAPARPCRGRRPGRARRSRPPGRSAAPPRGSS